ncbi:MAG: bifunctional folylpolyglutamate synthase/dihydrofolate synthase [Halanaerobiales bacterium]|nr:bifunctional folylpolyglutamate synthase/dihydrofolate synthase [Halanaerobiales bacterium]
MSYMDYINTFAKFKASGGFKPGHERILAILEKLDNPHQKVKVIHVAGTNGKGSTSAMMASIFHQSGYNVGFYSSPHLHHFSERMRYNGTPISDTELELMIKKIKPIVEEITKNPKLGRPSFFEITTALAYSYFAYKKVDVVLLEVGLGGRLDATNVINPLASVITTIGLDHTEYLGNTLAEIAFEKAGIIKDNTPVIIGVEEKEAYEVIEKQAMLKNAPLYTPLPNASWKNIEQNLSHQRFFLKVGDKAYPDLELALLGEHQIRNAVLAIETMNVVKEHFSKVDDEKIYRGLREVSWPGRLELVGEKPYILLDGAHNIAGIDVLAQFLEGIKENYNNLYLVMSILRDKDIEKMVKRMAPIATKIIFTQNENSRVSSAEELAQFVESNDVDIELKPNFEVAINDCITIAKDLDLICITGSFYTVAEARELLLEKMAKV